MPNSVFPRMSSSWNRRRFLQVGVLGTAVLGGIGGYQALRSRSTARSSVTIPPPPMNTPSAGNGINPFVMLRQFNYGVIKRENRRTIREFRITAGTGTLQLNSAVSFVTWHFNGQVPGPTLRANQGDRVRVVFFNQGGHSHSMHFHGVHRSEMDGVRPIRHGNAFIYEFDAEPFGVHVYHCHTAPITRHISKGLYGMFIVDPPQHRPPADEMVLIMGGFDINNDRQNEFYAFNGVPHYYMHYPIPIQRDQLIRLYVLNMIEFDVACSFHLHANFFQVYRTGRTFIPSEETDIITMGPAERHILEFCYRYPGKYMFHPHQDAIAEAGCMGQFEVI